MNFSYDLSTEIGLVRRNIGDTDDANLLPGAGVRWNGSNLTDEEINSHLLEHGEFVDSATGYCLLALASEYATKATTLQMGAIREELENASTELRRQANTWFGIAAARERRTADSAAYGGASSGTMPVIVVF